MIIIHVHNMSQKPVLDLTPWNIVTSVEASCHKYSNCTWTRWLISQNKFFFLVVIKVKVLSPRGRRSVVTSAAAGELLLSGDEVDDGADDCAVFGLTVLPVHRSRSLNFLLQQGVQLLFQTLPIKHTQR